MGTYVSTVTSLQILMIGTTFDTLTTALGTKCITLAESRINQSLSTKYDVSDFSTTVPPIITSWAERLAVGYMYRYLARGIGDKTNRDRAYIQSVEDELNMLISGKISLVDTSGSQIVEQTGVLCNTTDYVNTANEDDPINWSVDSDKLDDIADERE